MRSVPELAAQAGVLARRPSRALASICSYSGASQLACMLFDFTNRFDDLIHVAARAQQLGLGEPHGFRAEAVVRGTFIPLQPFLEVFLAIDPLISPVPTCFRGKVLC